MQTLFRVSTIGAVVATVPSLQDGCGVYPWGRSIYRL